MKWKISEAKARFSELVAEGKIEPQVIMNRERPVAVLMEFKAFEELQSLHHERKRPKVGDLLEELREINLEEEDLMIISRMNREINDLTDVKE